MEFIVIRDFNELEKYSEQWEKILRQNNNSIAFIEFDWIRSWWKHLGKYHELFVIMIRQGVEIVGFCPLMLTKKRFCTEVNFIGYCDICYLDFILVEQYRKSAVEGLLTYLIGIDKNYIFNLHGLAGNSADFHLLRDYLADRKVRHILCKLQSRYVDTSSGDFNSFYKERCVHTSIKNIARHERKLSKFGELTYVELDEKNIDGVFEIHDRRWHKKNDVSGFTKGDRREFFKELALDKSLSFRAKADGLYLGDRLIACMYSFICNKRLTWLRISHDDTFAVCGPGMIILKNKIMECFDGDIDICEFGVGGFQRYKSEWADNLESINRFIFPVGNLKARLSFLRYLFYETLKNHLREDSRIQHIKKNTVGAIKYYLSKEPYSRLAKAVAKLCSTGTMANLLQYYFYSRKHRDFIFYKGSLTAENAGGEIPDFRLEYATLHDIERIIELMHLNATDILKRLEKGQRCARLMYKDVEVAWMWTDNAKLSTREQQDIRPVERGCICIYDRWMTGYMKGRMQCKQYIQALLHTLYAEGYKKLCFVIESHEKCTKRALNELMFRKINVETANEKAVFNKQKAIS